MKKSFLLLLWCCVAIVFVVFGWLTYSILELDRRNASELHQRSVDEQARLALWRMDTALGGILLTENKRTPGEFSECRGEKLPPYVLSYFEVSPEGKLASNVASQTESDKKLREMEKELWATARQLINKEEYFSFPENGKPGSRGDVTAEFSVQIVPEQTAPAAQSDGFRADQQEIGQQTMYEQASNDFRARSQMQEQLNVQALAGNKAVQGQSSSYLGGVSASDKARLSSAPSARNDMDKLSKPDSDLFDSKDAAAPPLFPLTPVSPMEGAIKGDKELAMYDDPFGLNEDLAVGVASPPSAPSKLASGTSGDGDPFISSGMAAGKSSKAMNDVDPFDSDGIDPFASAGDEKLAVNGSPAASMRSDAAKSAVAKSKRGIVEGKAKDEVDDLVKRERARRESVAEIPEVRELNINEELQDFLQGQNLPQKDQLLAMDLSQGMDDGLFLRRVAPNFHYQKDLKSGELEAEAEDMPLSVSGFVPRWIKGELILLRTVESGEDVHVQGIWMNWQNLAAQLLDSAKDILPNARLEPYTDKEISSKNLSRLLTGVPMTLVTGYVASPLPLPSSLTLEISLILAWIFAIIAVIGVASLILGIIKLSERRATFVSAVTHELRTPLTTFNLYTEMLMNEMVPQARIKSYIATLQQEAGRLTHLVENVLSFSRVEKSTQQANNINLVRGEQLQESIMAAVSPILERAEMVPEYKASPAALKTSLLVNLSAVDQIMTNLADNSVKYAGEVSPRIEIEMAIAGNRLKISFRDYGRGIPEAMKARLFTPFSRSAEDAAGDKPGIGLGLALSNEIAKKMGGELKLDASCQEGTRFNLYIPLRK